MQNFLEDILSKVTDLYDTLENVVFVLPSKRGGVFLRNSIAKHSEKTVFAPEIYSIESFVEKIARLSYATNTQQLFELYHTYLKNEKGEKENFYSFSKWGQTILQDFNEIDRHLIDADNLFSNLTNIQEINHWSVKPEKTRMVENYLNFWNNLYPLYNDFNKALAGKGIGYQGQVYRKASVEVKNYLLAATNKTHVFIGFNALNTAEISIIQYILKNSNSEIYWDLDSYFLDDPIHDASFFIRKYKKSWSYFQEHSLQGITTNYSNKKNIKITGVPKNVSQVKYVGNLLESIHAKNPELLSSTALILGDESLLNPMLNAVPKEIDAVNITMGYALNKTPIANLFKQFFDLYLNTNTQGWFYQNLLSFLSHPQINKLLNQKDTPAINLKKIIVEKNWTYINLSKLEKYFKTIPNLNLLFFEAPTPKAFVAKCQVIILSLKDNLQGNNNLTEEYLYRFHTIFNQIQDLLSEYAFITDIKSLQSLYTEILSNETVDFEGDPLEGLQIMGMLESRTLDFDTVIITSVNEGILPSGKSNNSFIPFDLKTRLGLPTYKEKDAVYTYHFYRLLQRAKNIYIIYNTEPDVLEGGEKSRLISQILTDTNKENDINASIATPIIKPTEPFTNSVIKDTTLVHLIQKHAEKGFSPSSLSNYIRNPLDFYKQNLLGIDDPLSVEETVAANTIGTIIHDTLEDLYSPFIGKYLSSDGLANAKSQINSQVKKHFAKSYSDGDISYGQNLIAFNVVVRYIEKYIDLEIEESKLHKIKILGIEETLKIKLDIPQIDFPIFLKGKIDRVDTKDGKLRIIDYKTGKVESKNVEIVDWNEIITEYKYSKAFQLLCYTLLFESTNNIDTAEAGIVSFKNLKSGLLKFATKDSNRSRNKNFIITQETLSFFQEQLYNLILEICNLEVPFIEKEV